MAEPKKQIAESDIAQAVTQDEHALHDTSPDTSPKTTVPDVDQLSVEGSVDAHRTTWRGERDSVTIASDVVPYVSSGSAAGEADHPSFSGSLGRFQYLGTLGEGAFGVVVKVWDPELQTHRAIKIPHGDLIKSGRINADSYISEARKLASLGKHPGIVGVTDVQRMENGLPYVVSEYIPGGSLAEKTHGSRMPWRDAVTLVAQIADAVAHAHSKGIVHRDLKPANILLNDENKPVVADFGLALSDEEHSYRSSVCGTYQYMSPQQVSGQADRVDGRSDIYSLGVILYQLVAGRVPYKSRDVGSLKREIVNDEPTPLRQYAPDAPLRLQEICQRAMAKSLERRYSTAGDFAADLRALLAPQEPEATKGAPPVSKGGRYGAIAASVVGCGLVAWALFAAFPQRSDTDPIPPAPTSPPNLAIHFQKADQATFDRTLRDADLPLEMGDKLQFHVGDLTKPMFAYIYWLDNDGIPKRVWPEPAGALSAQKPVMKLSSPPGAGTEAVDQPWWEIRSVGKPLVFFVGVSEKMLDENQLQAFEEQTAAMRKSLMGALGRSGKPVAEFEFPEQVKTYQLRDGALYLARGGDLHLVIAPKVYASDHSQLKKWFSAYHGWIVASQGENEAATAEGK
jgi:serine/threonine protein kinase